jgi:predicted deacylase
VELENKILVVKELPDGSPVRIPYFIVDSKNKGPTTGIVATQHGNEFFSIVILKEFLKSKYPLKGKIIIFPVANPLAYNVKERTSRIDRKDMNRCWPGKEDGVITEKMCYSIFRILNRCGCVLDLHNGNDNILDTPQARLYEQRYADVRDLAAHLDVPFILLRKEPLENTLVGSLLDENITAITVELGEGKRITHHYITKGLKIIESFLSYTGNLPEPRTFESIPIDDDKMRLVTAENSGLFIPNIQQLGEKTDDLGNLITFPDFSEKKIRTPTKGHILSLWVGGVIARGELLARITKD